MPVPVLFDDMAFPDPSRADREGLVAAGGDLRAERLLDAYRRGIFPWYEEGQPILWFSPDPRFVLRAEELRVSRSLKRRMAERPFEIRLDTAFEQVIRACAETPRPGQEGTWITQDMVRAYVDLHERGFAHSAEAWLGGRLVGGLYGVSIGGLFCGESMFAWADDASKIAFVTLVRQMRRWGIATIDCQVPTGYLARFGARDWPRREFLRTVEELAAHESRMGPWALDADLSIPPAPTPGSGVIEGPGARHGPPRTLRHTISTSSEGDAMHERDKPRRETDLGHAELDEEHRGQLDLMDRLEGAIAEGRACPDIAQELAGLVAGLEVHFLSEQDAMLAHTYPDYEAHLKEHDRTLALLGDLKTRCASGDARMTSEAVAVLRAWLLAHIETTDRKLAEFMIARGISLH